MNAPNHDWKQFITDTFEVDVTPRAALNKIKAEIINEGQVKIKIYVTAVPENERPMPQ